MQVLAGIVAVLIAFAVLAHAVARARAVGGGALPGRRGQQPRIGQRPVRHEIKLAWEKARATDWLEWQRHDRALAAKATANGDGTPSAGKPVIQAGVVPATPAPTPLQRAYRAVQTRTRRPQNGSGPPGTAAPAGTGPGARPDGAGGASAPRPAPPAPASPPSAVNGRNTPVTASGAAVEQFVEGVNQIHAHAQAGGLHAKHGGVKASHEGATRFAAMAAMLSRAMSEPGMNYGPEITEPIAKAGTHLQAAAMSFSEADAALTSLANMTVGDLANSARQAPHHSELTESGSH